MEAAAFHRLGREAWPGIDVPLDAFSRFIADRDPSTEHAPSLYLTCGCARRDARAIAALEASYFDAVRAAVARVVKEPARTDEAMQLLRDKLFLAEPDKEPGIGGYAGRGDLRGWLRVAATRVALGLLRARRADDGDGDADLERIVGDDRDPEAALLRARYAAPANDALREAFAALDTRERNLLRQSFVDRLSIDALAGLYGVHRATAARWLEKAREKLEKRTRKLLMQRLGVGDATADSIVRMVQSDLHLTLSGT